MQVNYIGALRKLCQKKANGDASDFSHILWNGKETKLEWVLAWLYTNIPFKDSLDIYMP